MSAGLSRRSPAPVRTLAATRLPRYPTAPAAASAHRCVGGVGWMSRDTASTAATQALMKMAATTNSPAARSALDTYPLERATEALQALATSHTQGKLAIRIA